MSESVKGILFALVLTVAAFVIGLPGTIYAAGVLFGLAVSDAVDAWYSK